MTRTRAGTRGGAGRRSLLRKGGCAGATRAVEGLELPWDPDARQSLGWETGSCGQPPLGWAGRTQAVPRTSGWLPGGRHISEPFLWTPGLGGTWAGWTWRCVVGCIPELRPAAPGGRAGRVLAGEDLSVWEPAVSWQEGPRDPGWGGWWGGEGMAPREALWGDRPQGHCLLSMPARSPFWKTWAAALPRRLYVSELGRHAWLESLPSCGLPARKVHTVGPHPRNSPWGQKAGCGHGRVQQRPELGDGCVDESQTRPWTVSAPRSPLGQEGSTTAGTIAEPALGGTGARAAGLGRLLGGAFPGAACWGWVSSTAWP